MKSNNKTRSLLKFPFKLNQKVVFYLATWSMGVETDNEKQTNKNPNKTKDMVLCTIKKNKAFLFRERKRKTSSCYWCEYQPHPGLARSPLLQRQVITSWEEGGCSEIRGWRKLLTEKWFHFLLENIFKITCLILSRGFESLKLQWCEWSKPKEVVALFSLSIHPTWTAMFFFFFCVFICY